VADFAGAGAGGRLAVAGGGGGGVIAAVPLPEGGLVAAGEPASAAAGFAEGIGAGPALAFDAAADTAGPAVCGFGEAAEGAGAASPLAAADCAAGPAEI
jgi:hypothetical protein